MSEPMEPQDLNDPALRDRAVRAARGEEPFDMLLTGGMLADVATGELRRGRYRPGRAADRQRAPAGHARRRRCCDRTGGTDRRAGADRLRICISKARWSRPRRYAEVVVPQGTTTICWDPHEIGNVSGLPGVRWAIEAAQGLPLRILPLAPSCVPSAPGLERGGAVFGPDEMREMLRWPEIAGVAEVMDMRGVLERRAKMRGIVDAGLASGKLVCGHARGLAGADLQGFAAAGIESDHEITCGEDLVAKLRAGFTVELRGSHDYVLPGAVEALNALPLVPQTLTICTDDVFPDDLVTAGGMIDVLRRLVRYGLPPMQALRCRDAERGDAAGAAGPRAGGAGAARRLACAVGSASAGGARRCSPRAGWWRADGRLLAPLRPDPPGAPADTMHVPPLTEDDFRLAAAGLNAGQVRLRTVDKPRFTEWGEAVAEVRDGAVVLPDDAMLMAVIHRHGKAPAAPVLGVLQGWSTLARRAGDDGRA